MLVGTTPDAFASGGFAHPTGFFSLRICDLLAPTGSERLNDPHPDKGDSHMRLSSILLAAMTAIAAPALAQTPKLVMEEMMVPSGDPGIDLYVRNKRPADMASFRPERTLLYVHGATYPSSTAFDLRLDGLSWMDY